MADYQDIEEQTSNCCEKMANCSVAVSSDSASNAIHRNQSFSRLTGNESQYKISSIVSRDGGVDDPFRVTMAQETNFQMTHDTSGQSAWMLRRAAVLESIKEIIYGSSVLDALRPCDRIAEFGSGAYGWFNNFIFDNGRWLEQYDINPKAVKSNRKFSKKYFGSKPKVNTGSIYDMPYSDCSLDMLIGCNSWDSIYFFDRAIEETSRVLKPGGRFFHYQDVGPADVPIVMVESLRRQAKSLGMDVPSSYHKEIVNLGHGFTREDYHLISIDSTEYGKIGTDEYLHRHLGGLLEKHGFEILRCGRFSAENIISPGKVNERYNHLGYRIDEQHNAFEFEMGKLWMEHDDSVPDGSFRQRASAHLLLAEKR